MTAPDPMVTLRTTIQEATGLAPTDWARGQALAEEVGDVDAALGRLVQVINQHLRRKPARLPLLASRKRRAQHRQAVALWVAEAARLGAEAAHLEADGRAASAALAAILDRAKAMREARKTQQEVAAALGVGRVTVSDWERESPPMSETDNTGDSPTATNGTPPSSPEAPAPEAAAPSARIDQRRKLTSLAIAEIVKN